VIALTLTAEEEAMSAGARGDAAALAMKIVVTLARILRAPRLVEIGSAHVDGCLFHGQVGLDFVDRLVAGGGRVAVPTTLNVSSLDLLHPELVRLAPATRDAARRLMDGYVALGATPTWTCAPYQLRRRPAFGEHIAWAESNAIVFANSVLGARTDRYGDFLDICAGITGRAPFAGLHRDENRRGRVLFDCSGLSRRTLGLDAAWAALGHLVGETVGGRVPVLAGLPPDASEDQLKALGAAAASSGGVGLFHAVGLTPEAATVDDAFHGFGPDDVVAVSMDRLRAARDALTTGADTVSAAGAGPGASAGAGGRVDAVSIGTPHYSLAEFARLASLLESGEAVHPDVQLWVSTGRDVLDEAEALGYVATCRAAGARILVDTCTYVTSVLGPKVRVVMTDSAKWAWYAPANLGVGVVFASLEECVRSARAGSVVRDEDLWS
jgi:predicted aconitase